MLDLVFPPSCVGCGRIGRWVCEECWREIGWLPADMREVTHFPGSPLQAVYAAAQFDGTAREAVHALKYNGQHAISPVLGRSMAGVVPEQEIDLVAPVSLHSRRKRERGYDQAAMLAGRVAAALDLTHEQHLLKRVKYTRQQVGLEADERRRNVAGAFEATRSLAGEAVLIVDDVLTTGSTLGEAARALVEAGAGRVTGVVFARAF